LTIRVLNIINLSFFFLSQTTQTTKKVVQFQSVEQPNGGIKEVCLTKDSYGNSEKITTRIIGDKIHSIRETTDFQGYLELEERCENFDEGFVIFHKIRFSVYFLKSIKTILY
jgi:hypothetical protein